MLCMSITTLPRPLNFTSLLQYKREGVRLCCGDNVVQSNNVVLQYRSQKEQSDKFSVKKKPRLITEADEMKKRLLQDKLLNRVGHAVFQVRFGHEISHFFHRRNGVIHRHAHARELNHRDVVFLIAQRHDLFRLNA